MIKEHFTIVIPCRNEENYIERTLQSIENQQFVKGTRVIIADAQSTDKTREKIVKYALRSRLNIEIIEGGSVAFGRNAGAKLADTKWIIFMDADSILMESDILMETIYSFIFHKKTLITCKQKPTNKNTLLSIFHKIFNTIQKWMPETFSTGVFFAIDKKTFLKLGCFDESVHQSEDYLLSRKIGKKDFKIINRYVGQDERRYKKMGYFGMIKLVISNWFNRNNIEHFRRDINYWK